jgi:hypothetical protein
VLANRLSSVASKIIRPSQTVFLPGRYILEGAIILHEKIHELKRKRAKKRRSQTLRKHTTRSTEPSYGKCLG